MIASLALWVAGTAPAFAGGSDPSPGDNVIGNAGGLRYAKDSKLLQGTPAAFGRADAGCGQSALRYVTGGGGRFQGGAARPRVVWTGPLDAASGDLDMTLDDGWTWGAYGPAGKLVTAFSICKRQGQFRHLNATLASEGDPIRDANIGCGTGGDWHVLSGGVSISNLNNADDSYLISSYPFDSPISDQNTRPDDGWAVRVYDAEGGTGVVSIFIVCMRGSGISYQSRSGERVPAGKAGVRRARCGKERHVAGGGVLVRTSPVEPRVAGSYPIDGDDRGKVPDDGWKSVVYNASSSRKRVTTFATCLRG